MQIFMNGRAQKDYAPDQIYISTTFAYQADSYDEALRGGVRRVKSFIEQITRETDFTFDDFKTRAYSVREQFHTNRIEPKQESDLSKNLQQRVSDGFFFSQYAYLAFDYDKERLAKLLVLASQIPGAPRLNVDFGLKDVDSKKRELIADAYEDAKKKAEALAGAAKKHLRDCVRVEIDSNSSSRRDGLMLKESVGYDMDMANAFNQEIKNIDETFKPDNITVSECISCIWETSD